MKKSQAKPMASIQTLEKRRDQARSQFTTLGDLRRGTLSRTASRCGKLSCRCAKDGDPGHPGHVLQRSLDGRQKSVRIRAHEVEENQAQIEECRRFRTLSLEFLKPVRHWRKQGWLPGEARAP